MIAHALSRFALGGLKGIQSCQRDWSPFVAHFTSYAAMNSIRSTVDTGTSGYPVSPAKQVHRRLRQADAMSFQVVTLIQNTGVIRSSHPGGDTNILACVSLSECNLPSLVSHAERYGRFGFVFMKSEIFIRGGRPCAYLQKTHRDLVIKSCRDAARTQSPSAGDWAVFASLCQVHRPITVPGRPIQDYTHEREWRLFSDINLADLQPSTILAPREYISRVRQLFPAIDHVVSIDDLFEWGA